MVGPYFTPAVDASGNISWTNNGDLPNPTTRNITGPQGTSIDSVTKASGTGAPGTTDVYNVNLDDSTVAGKFRVYNGADGEGSPGTSIPQMDGTGAAGVAIAYAREDHVHPTDTSRADSTIVGDGSLSGFTATDLTGAANELIGITGDGTLSGFTATDLTDAANELKTDINDKVTRVTGTISSSQLYISNANITTDMVLVECVFGTPTNVNSDLTWNTNTAGRLTFSGTLGGSTTVDAVLVKI